VSADEHPGSTTTPFDMMLVNEVSRYHVAMDAVEKSRKLGDKRKQLVEQLQKNVEATRNYILENGDDIAGIYGTPEFE
jgi:xylulose-5-phosphate/fructose-6-phosphate phosphoketolase